jgi:hypothetical protein
MRERAPNWAQPPGLLAHVLTCGQATRSQRWRISSNGCAPSQTPAATAPQTVRFRAHIDVYAHSVVSCSQYWRTGSLGSDELIQVSITAGRFLMRLAARTPAETRAVSRPGGRVLWKGGPLHCGIRVSRRRGAVSLRRPPATIAPDAFPSGLPRGQAARAVRRTRPRRHDALFRTASSCSISAASADRVAVPLRAGRPRAGCTSGWSWTSRARWAAGPSCSAGTRPRT